MGLQELRELLSIEEVVSKYLPLKRAGSNLKANCPFHPDKTPSFFVSPSKGIFKCFGCGVGGDAIKFVSLYENLSYWEAAKKLAREYGYELEGGSEKESSLLRKVISFYREALLDSREAREYLKKRRVSPSTAEKFGIGFSPSPYALAKELSEEEVQLLLSLGHLTEGAGGYADRFAGRIVFPVYSPSGEPAGFSGRLLEEEKGKPKYLNSPESKLFKKGKLLYNFHRAREYAREKGYFVVVEGFFDVIALWQEGERSVVAPMGTSLTPEQCALMKRYAGKCVLVFDGDEAGRKAVKRATSVLLEAELEPAGVLLDAGKDPFDYCLEGRAKELREKIKKAPSLFSLLERLSPTKAYELLKEYGKHIKDPEKLVHLHEKVFPKLGLSRKEAERLLGKRSGEKRKVQKRSELSLAEKVLVEGVIRLGMRPDLDKLLLGEKAREILSALLEGREVGAEAVVGRIGISDENLPHLYAQAEKLLRERKERKTRIGRRKLKRGL